MSQVFFEVEIIETTDWIEDDISFGAFPKDQPKFKRHKGTFLSNKRLKKRKTDRIPWTYHQNCTSDFEQSLRIELEIKWREGRDDELPEDLMKYKSWSYFWERQNKSIRKLLGR